MGVGSHYIVDGRIRLGGGFRAALGEVRALKGSGQALEEPGDDGGDGGVVFGGEMAGLAVDLRGDADGDVFDFAHGGVSLGPDFWRYWYVAPEWGNYLQMGGWNLHLVFSGLQGKVGLGACAAGSDQPEWGLMGRALAMAFTGADPAGPWASSCQLRSGV